MSVVLREQEKQAWLEANLKGLERMQHSIEFMLHDLAQYDETKKIARQSRLTTIFNQLTENGQEKALDSLTCWEIQSIRNKREGNSVDANLLNNEKIVTECTYAPRFFMWYKISIALWSVFTVAVFFGGVAIGGIVNGLESAWLIAVIDALVIYAMYAQQQTKLVLTNKRLMGTKGIFKKEILDVPLDKIDNVSVKTKFSESIGEISIYSNSGIYTMQKFDRPVIMRLAILEQINIYKQEQAEMHAQAIAKAMKNA